MEGQPQHCHSVHNLRDILENYAWKKYQSSTSMSKRLFQKKEKHTFDIQWNFVDFKHMTVSATNGLDDSIIPLEFGTPVIQRNRSKSKRGAVNTEFSYQSVSLDMDAPVILGTEYFENDSTRPRTFPYSTHEQLKSTVSVKFFQSYSLGGSRTNLELSGKVYGAADRMLSVHNAVRQDFDDLHSFHVDTAVQVEPGQKAEAVISVFEKQTVSRFEVASTLSLAVGCLPVVIRRKSDGGAMFTCFVTSLNDVFSNHVGPNLSLVNAGDGIYDVVITSRGTCTSTVWSDPELIVKAEPIRLLGQ